MRRFACALGAWLCAGCLDFGKVDDAKAPGDLLGMYLVSGELEESTCGEGALGAAETWEFEVKLTRYESDLYWLNGREAIVGSIAEDGRSFTFSTRVEREVAPAKQGRAACRVARDDRAAGVLSASGIDVEGFVGKLEFGYRELEDSDCSGWIGTPGAVSRLPCEMTYTLAAERQEEP